MKNGECEMQAKMQAEMQARHLCPGKHDRVSVKLVKTEN
jgi:hypothetical protein